MWWISLITADPDQYDNIMNPMLLLVESDTTEDDTNPRCGAHSQVCMCIQHAIVTGIEVEITVVDKLDMDKAKLQEFSCSTM